MRFKKSRLLLFSPNNIRQRDLYSSRERPVVLNFRIAGPTAEYIILLHLNLCLFNMLNARLKQEGDKEKKKKTGWI
jgi:hypothetical protein